MGIEEKLPSGILLTSVEKLAGYARKSSVWPATFGLACCAMELISTGGPRHDLARFGMERASNTPRQADLMIVAGRVSQKMGPVLRQIYDQMADPKWVISMGVCASSGGMFNNYAIVQGVDHIVPVDIYLPGCPPRPEMLLDAIVKLHDKIQNMKLGANREAEVEELEQARLRRLPLTQGTGGQLGIGGGQPQPRGAVVTSENAPGTSDQPDPAAAAGELRLGEQVERTGMFRHRDHRRHLGLRRAAGAAPGPGGHRPPLRVLLRRDRRPARRGPGARRPGVRRGGVPGGGRARRTDSARAARAPGGGRQAAAGRAVAGLPDVPGGQRSPLPLGHRE